MVRGLGERLFFLRVRRNLTRKEVGEVVNISPVSLAQYEAGDVNPKLETLAKLADFYKCSTDFLLTGKDKYKLDVSGLTDSQISLIEIIIKHFIEEK